MLHSDRNRAVMFTILSNDRAFEPKTRINSVTQLLLCMSTFNEFFTCARCSASDFNMYIRLIHTKRVAPRTKTNIYNHETTNNEIKIMSHEY
jgi:hypothetical protein